MKKSSQVALLFGALIVVVGIVAGGRSLILNHDKYKISVVVPTLSAEAAQGEKVFVAQCAACHGNNAAGTDKGPSLVDPIYRPLHHSDFSFIRAVTLGVPQHHWFFGAMPAQPQVRREQIDQVVVYVRELQQANGIR
jgi:mono/diheme cytochrome c family protein